MSVVNTQESKKNWLTGRLCLAEVKETYTNTANVEVKPVLFAVIILVRGCMQSGSAKGDLKV
jgi:hypothetical protein